MFMRENIMTIEDFFTLTKLEDGFTDPAQVKELFAIIAQEEDDHKDSVVKKVDVLIHQWSTIASAIITTDNKECLDAFAQLDKLRYIDKLLLHAQKIGTETGDALVEDLLRVLEKLQIDKHNLIPSGIWTTVENIAQNNNSSMIQERAKALVFDKWKEEVKSDSVCVQDIEMAASVDEKGLNDDENSAEYLGDQQKLVDIETSENSLDHVMMTTDAEQMRDSSGKLLVATLEQRDEIPKSAIDLTNASSHSDSEKDIDTKGGDPCLNKDSVQSSDSLHDSGVVGEVIEQVNDGAENDCDGAEFVVSPQRSSPDTRKGEEERNTSGTHNKTQAGSNGSTEASPMAEEPVTVAKNLSVETGSCIEELFSPNVVTHQEHNVDKVNGSGSLDLNQQVSSEDKQADFLLKQQGGFVGFDLNMAEGSDDEHVIIETQSEPRQTVISSKYTHLDLNRMCDDDSDNDIQSQSPSSDSSSSRRFDLNDVPFSKNTDDARVIKIMGTHVKLHTQKFVPQTLSLSQTNIPNPGTPGALGFGSKTSCYVGLVPGLAAFYGPDASTIPCAGSSSASTVPYTSNGVVVDLNSDPEMEEGVDICTTAGLFSSGGENEYFRGTKRKVADSQWEH